jgi:hypothetical protein
MLTKEMGQQLICKRLCFSRLLLGPLLQTAPLRTTSCVELHKEREALDAGSFVCEPPLHHPFQPPAGDAQRRSRDVVYASTVRVHGSALLLHQTVSDEVLRRHQLANDTEDATVLKVIDKNFATIFGGPVKRAVEAQLAAMDTSWMDDAAQRVMDTELATFPEHLWRIIRDHKRLQKRNKVLQDGLDEMTDDPDRILRDMRYNFEECWTASCNKSNWNSERIVFRSRPVARRDGAT